MAMRSLLSRNLTGATRCYSDGTGFFRLPNAEKKIGRQHSEKLEKEKAAEKLKKEEAEKKKAEKEKEDADKKSEGTHLG